LLDRVSDIERDAAKRIRSGESSEMPVIVVGMLFDAPNDTTHAGRDGVESTQSA
jgi:hypothetical protein